MTKKTYTGINIQWPISELILSGKKTIETRTYPIPEKYLNQEMLMIETPGKKGKFKSRIVAIIKFTECFEYKSKSEFYRDINKHYVSKNSFWAWEEKSKYGWRLIIVHKFNKSLNAPVNKGIIYTNNIILTS